MKILVAVFVGLLLVGCGKKEEPIASKRAEVLAAEAAESVPAVIYKPMTNDEIISETKKCESAGLNAEGLKIDATFGAQFVMIQCVPITKEAK